MPLDPTGVIPGTVLSKSPALPGLAPLNAAQAHGREVYVGEGCSYCHTQFVRPLAQDHVWGRASVAGDYTFSTPQLLGTELKQFHVRDGTGLKIWHAQGKKAALIEYKQPARRSGGPPGQMSG